MHGNRRSILSIKALGTEITATNRVAPNSGQVPNRSRLHLRLPKPNGNSLVGEGTGENTNKLNALRDYEELLNLTRKQQAVEALTAIERQRTAAQRTDSRPHSRGTRQTRETRQEWRAIQP